MFKEQTIWHEKFIFGNFLLSCKIGVARKLGEMFDIRSTATNLINRLVI
jgi:hypothetical protein